ncbi:unnamed protein product [Trichobilharzia regenti]|nr:unnamed protein product [Trichobilharzia regenti]
MLQERILYRTLQLLSKHRNMRLPKDFVVMLLL